jgi:hypothetical protein
LGVTALTYASCREKARERYGPLTNSLTHHNNSAAIQVLSGNRRASISRVETAKDSESSEELSGIEEKEKQVVLPAEKIESEKTQDSFEVAPEKGVNENTSDNIVQNTPLLSTEILNVELFDDAKKLTESSDIDEKEIESESLLKLGVHASNEPLTKETVEQSFKQTTQEIIRQTLDNIKEVVGTSDSPSQSLPSTPSKQPSQPKPASKVNTSPHNIRHQIMRDLPRTFPQLGLFEGVESGAYMQLLTVLVCCFFFSFCFNFALW